MIKFRDRTFDFLDWTELGRICSKKYSNPFPKEKNLHVLFLADYNEVTEEYSSLYIFI